MPNFRNVEIQSSKLLSALSLVAGYGLVGDRDQGYDVNAGNEEANEVDVRVGTKKRTMDVLLNFFFFLNFLVIDIVKQYHLCGSSKQPSTMLDLLL